LPSWHEPLLFDGRKKGVLVAFLCLLLAGPLCADLIATSISTDGSVMLKTTGSDENGSFASLILSRDEARVSRTTGDESGLDEELTVRSSGPTLFRGYADALLSTSGIKTICALLDTPHETGGSAEAHVSGIIKGGEYSSSRMIGPGLSDITAVNGSGLLLLGSGDEGNRTLRATGFVSGNMSVQDMVKYGVKI